MPNPNYLSPEAKRASIDDIRHLLEGYVPDTEVQAKLDVAPVLLVCGPSGVGKNTLINSLLSGRPKAKRIVSVTSRRPRQNNGVMEVDGVEYNFRSLEYIAEQLKAGRFVEGNVYGGNFYGVHGDELDLADDLLVGDVDINGLESFAKLGSASLRSVFCLPPSFEAWEDRFLRRYPVNRLPLEDIERRLCTSCDEYQYFLDHSNMMYGVINSTTDAAVAKIMTYFNSGMVCGDVVNEPAVIELAETLGRMTREVLGN